MAEALVQSHAGEISLLPALPAGWDDGSVSGLRARGEYDVSMQWKDGKLQAADIHSLKGGAIKVRYGQKSATIAIKPGKSPFNHRLHSIPIQPTIPATECGNGYRRNKIN